MFRKTLIGFWLVAWFALSCSSDEPDVLLVVQSAQEQPSLAGNGIIVVVQSTGGRWLEVAVQGATLGDGRTARCLPAPVGGQLSERLTNFVVYPAQGEAVVMVRLLPDGPTDADADATPVVADPARPCGIDTDPLREVIKPVQRLSAAPPTSPSTAGTGGDLAVGGGGGTAGTGESGGTSFAGQAGAAETPSASGAGVQ
ncbi:MAG: hypothetical protein WDO69_18850 [Pseudomonadota bacterium]